MPNETQVSTDPVQETNPQNTKIKSKQNKYPKGLLIVLILLGFLLVAGISGLIGYQISQNKKEKNTGIISTTTTVRNTTEAVSSTNTSSTTGISTGTTSTLDKWKTYSNNSYAVIRMQVLTNWEPKAEKLSAEDQVKIFELQENVIRFYDTNKNTLTIYKSAYGANTCLLKGGNVSLEQRQENGLNFKVCKIDGVERFYMISYQVCVDDVVSMDVDMGLVSEEDFFEILNSIKINQCDMSQ
jgi:hypothetical protein